MKKILFWFILLCTSVHAQLPASILSDNLIYDASKSDDFNGDTLDHAKWWYVDACNDTDSIKHGFNWGGNGYFRPQNVSVSSGNLQLKVEFNPDSLDSLTPCLHHHPYTFYSGGVISVLTNGPADFDDIGNYSFGYYEMRAKLPGYYDSLHNPVGYGFMPTFWIYYQHWFNGCVIGHDEVDILEPNTLQFYDARTNVVGWHDEFTDTCGGHKVGQDSMRSAEPLFEDYHTYGLEVLPDKISFFFDGQPFYSADTITSPEIAHSLNMSPYLAVVMSVQMSSPSPLPDAPIPQYMYVDYFRYYHMREDVVREDFLSQNSPNPVTDETEIGYNVKSGAGSATINFFNLTGALVKSVTLTEGKSKITFQAGEFIPGIYFYSLINDNRVMETKKMVVMK